MIIPNAITIIFLAFIAWFFLFFTDALYFFAALFRIFAFFIIKINKCIHTKIKVFEIKKYDKKGVDK
jgi:hypothetical protein